MYLFYDGMFFVKEHSVGDTRERGNIKMHQDWFRRKKSKLTFNLQRKTLHHSWQDFFHHLDQFNLSFAARNILLQIAASSHLMLEEKIKSMMTLLMQHHIDAEFMMTDSDNTPIWHITTSRGADKAKQMMICHFHHQNMESSRIEYFS